MKGYKYYQLLDENYNNLVKDDENPANIPDGTHGQTAFRMAREWMKANKVKFANLVANIVSDNGGDDISNIREITLA